MAQPAEQDRLLEGVRPHDEAAEAGVLGAMLIDERAATAAIELLKKEDFFLPRHQLLFELFYALFDQQPDLDLLFVLDELEKRGLSDRVGGADYVGHLIERTPNAANIERYCRIVREKAIQRELIERSGQILQMARQGVGPDGDAFSLTAEAERLIFEIADQRASGEPVKMNEIINTVLAQMDLHIQARLEGREIPSPAVPTQFSDLDRLLAGGLWPGEVVIVAARPSVGKTTFSINIARKVAVVPEHKQPVPVGIFSMEMPKEQVSKNILCAEAQVSSGRMRNYQFTAEEYEDVKYASIALRNAPIYIDDTPALGTTELRARARRLHHRHQVKLLVIDYLQLMQAPGRPDSREQAVAEMSRQVKAIARELSIPIILISQLRRPVQGKESAAPTMADLRESGSIEQDADVIVMLHRKTDENNIYTNEIRAYVQKNRNGELGDFQLSYFPDRFRFENYTPEFAGA